MADCANAANDIPGDDHLFETARVSLKTIVQLAYRVAAMAGCHELMSPRFYRAFIRMCVRPIADVIDVLAGSETRTGRNTDRTIGVCVSKASATCCKSIQVWCLDDVMTRATHCTSLMLVRHNKEKIGRLQISHKKALALLFIQ